MLHFNNKTKMFAPSIFISGLNTNNPVHFFYDCALEISCMDFHVYYYLFALFFVCGKKKKIKMAVNKTIEKLRMNIGILE